MIEALEAGRAYRSASLDEADPGEETLSARLGSEDRKFGDAEWRVVLLPHLETLPPRERAILRHRFVDGLTQTEIASRVGISQMHVSRLLARSLAVLRDVCTSTLEAS